MISPIYYPPSAEGGGGGGVVNTGDAAVGDVANGKTFSSAALTNATGTSTKNATVPGNTSILPAQAFVDSYLIFIAGISANKFPNIFHLENSGITSVTSFLNHWDFSSGDGTPDGYFQGNALATSEINAILAKWAATPVIVADGILDLSGGTNAAPTGQGLTDKATLITAGWTVTTN